jgi:two-component system CheB/CheR fusion protein
MADESKGGKFGDLRRRAEQILGEGHLEVGDLSLDEARDLIHDLRVYQIELELQNEELRRAQNELAESKRRYVDLYDFAPVGYLTVAKTGLITRANLTLADMLGVPRREIIGELYSNFILKDDREAYYDFRHALFETKMPQVGEVRMVDANGSTFYARLVGSLANDDADGIIGWRAAVIDITDRKRAEEAIRQSEQEFRALVENSVDSIVRLDRESHHLYVNPAFARRMGMLPGEIIGKTNAEIGIPEDACRVFEDVLREVYETGHEQTIEFFYPTPEGERYFQARLAPEFAPDGEVDTVLVISRDVTERHRLEKKRLQLTVEKERRRLLQDFLSTASQEFRTPLSTINAHLYILKRLCKNKEHAQRIMTIQQQVDYIANLTEDIIKIAHLNGNPQLFLELVNPNELALDICKRSESLIREKDLQLVRELEKDVPSVSGDKKELYLMLKNVVENALYYTPEGGRVTVRTRKQDGNVIIEVQDRGSGISAQDLPLIFEPFFRGDQTKSERHAGLGLTIAEKIAHLHGGSIQVESEKSEGSLFRIMLPCSGGENC